MKKALDYFRDISAVPRGSGNCSQIADYIVDFARSLGLKYRRDEFDNVVIFKEAAKGRENDNVVMLQGHTDMVCEKDADIDHDFLTQGIELVEEGDILKANGTTLGADDGVAVALMMELLADKTLNAPALECVFTTDEEVGLCGADQMDFSDCKAKYLINADSEEEGVFTCGCCGGSGVTFTVPVTRVKKKGTFYNISISGLKGGHSGAEIDKGRLNAIQLLAEILEPEDEIVSIERDGKDNVIPLRCDAVAMAIESTIRAKFECKKSEWQKVEENVTLTITPAGITEADVLDRDSAARVIKMLRDFPFGPQKMCDEPAGLVHTSDNLGIVNTSHDTVTGTLSCRSVEIETKMELINKISAIVEEAGGSVFLHGMYPGWEYKKESKLRDIMVDVYEKMYGKKPEIAVIHAGLECGLILSKMPDLDIISIGCEIHDIHSSRERMSMSSFERMTDFVRKVLEVIK